MGIRGSHNQECRKEQLGRFGVSERRIANLIRDMEAQTLSELVEIYSVCHAALQIAGPQ